MPHRTMLPGQARRSSDSQRFPDSMALSTAVVPLAMQQRERKHGPRQGTALAAFGSSKSTDFQRMLFELAQFGQITIDELGKFTSVDELLGPINDAADATNSLARSAADAAGQLGDLNVPNVFKRSLFAFQASSAEPALPNTLTRFPGQMPGLEMPALASDQAPSDLLRSVDSVTEAIKTVAPDIANELKGLFLTASDARAFATQRPGDGASLPVGGPSIVQHIQNVFHVTQLPGESGQEFSERVASVLQRKGVVGGGDSQVFGPF
jgi:hypothetical protein